MGRLFTALFALLALASMPSWAQTTGRIAMSATPDGSTCTIMDTEPGVVEIHIVVFDVEGLSAIQFAAPKPNCWSGATWLADEFTTELTIGDTQDPVGGLAAAWGTLCPDGPVYLGLMRFATAGQATPCCEYPIIKATGDLHPEVPGPIVVLCSDPTHIAGITVDGVVNPDPGCPCQTPIAVEETTWGGIKAMYR